MIRGHIRNFVAIPSLGCFQHVLNPNLEALQPELKL